MDGNRGLVIILIYQLVVIVDGLLTLVDPLVQLEHWLQLSVDVIMQGSKIGWRSQSHNKALSDWVKLFAIKRKLPL